MEIDKAKEVAAKYDELEQAKKQLTKFNETKEFCKIKITGEDGSERERSFYFDSKKDNESVVKIRQFIEGVLEDRIDNIKRELEVL